MEFQNVIPIVTIIDPSNVSPGATVTVTVRVNRVPTVDQPLDIAGSPQGAFSSLPSIVTVPTTSDEVSFSATLSLNASGGVSVTATCNGVSAVGNCYVAA